MTARWFTAVAVSLIALSACNPFRRDTAVQVSARDAMINSRWHANLASPASLAGVVQMSGSASMTPGVNGTSTIITLDLANAAPGGVHPWGAHYGQCGEGMDNGVFGTSQAYQALKVASDGHAKGTATVSLETPHVGNYFVVIRASALNPDLIVACGNLAPPTQ